ncbi:MAG TPA: radical SAM protein [bacterium]|nr:radical SAM protein [bacterium]
MAELVLVNPPLTSWEQYCYLQQTSNNVAPLGLLNLAAVTRQAGIKTAIVDAEALGLSYEQAIEKALSHRPSVVGVTAVTLSISNAARFAAGIKAADSRVKLAIGGPHLSAVPEETMSRYPEFDVGSIGEGEVTVLELMQAFRGERTFESVNGLILRGEQGTHRTPPREYLEDLDHLPFQAWDLLEHFPDIYTPPVHSFGRLPVAALYTTRGCPARCTFCSKNVFGNRIRFFSADYVLEAIRRLIRDYGIREIKFYDDNMTFSKDRFYGLCEGIIREKMDITWTCVSRVDLVNDEMLVLAKRAGCWQISYGLEAASVRLLEFVKKGTNLEKVRRALHATHKAGIRTRGYFIAGLPTQTKDELEETVRFALREYVDDFQIHLFVPFPGTPISENIEQYGEVVGGWHDMNKHKVVFIPHGWTAEELDKAYNNALRRFYIRPKTVISYLGQIRSWDVLVKFIKSGITIAWHWFFGGHSEARHDAHAQAKLFASNGSGRASELSSAAVSHQEASRSKEAQL